MRKTRILHIINSFELGGAEVMLVNLLLRTDRSRYKPSVVALIDDLSTAQPIIDAGIPLTAMGMQPGVPDPRGILRLAKYIQRSQPDVIQTWMDHSNLIGTLATVASTWAPVVWGIHHSNHIAGVAKRSTLMTVNACGLLSRLAARIVYCSHHSRHMYSQRGYSSARAEVIPNGFDTARFQPDPDARRHVRQEIGIAMDTPLIGLVARFDPFKDHTTFFEAAARLTHRRPDVHFLLCGSGVDYANPALASQIIKLGLGDRCHLLGRRRDVPRIHAALDLLTSSSISEAFPLVLGEAMSCGVPCVATDVGDSALIVGNTGRIVAPRNPARLADAWSELLQLAPEQRAALGAAARQRIREHFDLDAVTRRYHEVYDQLAHPQHRLRRASAMPAELPHVAIPTQMVPTGI